MNAAIVGTPKSGTSSLFSWLDAHPELEGSRPKETFFFMDERHPLFGRHGVSYLRDGCEAYGQFFEGKEAARRRFEGTTHYYYQETARSHLASLRPQPLIIVLIREPAARIFSSFRSSRDHLVAVDRSMSFNDYVDCLLAGDEVQIARHFLGAENLYVARKQLRLSKYAHWLGRWAEYLDAGRLEVVVFEELKHDPSGVVQKVCELLEVDGKFYRDFNFKVMNKTARVSRHFVHRIARGLYAGAPGAWVPAGLKARYFKWQAKAAPLEKGYRAGLERLREFFAPWNEELAAYGVDVQRWWSPTSGRGRREAKETAVEG